MKSAARRIGESEEAAGRKWYAYAETDLPNAWYNNQTYSNTLDEKTIDRFIAVTYVRYLACIGGDFGGVVPAIFTDEPQFAHKATLDFSFEAKDVILPWTDNIPQTFQKAYGADILDSLPELLWELPITRAPSSAIAITITSPSGLPLRLPTAAAGGAQRMA